MPFLIDGHNLIPKLGLSLSSFDDELELLERLNEFSRLSRKGQLEVYFDNALPGTPESRRNGQITAHFVRKPLIADEAIRLRLRKLGKAAKNWSVVSSDHRVQAEARASGAKVISSDEFAATVIDTLRSGPPPAGKQSTLTDRELEDWLALFASGENKSRRFKP
jgi:predicted RNA-binding protein with PIN domain